MPLGPTQRGTGTELRQAEGMARRAAGRLRLQRVRGRGTVAVLLLPAAGARTRAGTDLLGAEAALPSPLSLLVLLADDDAAVRQVSAEMLSALGCRVLEAADAAAGEVPGVALRVPDVVLQKPFNLRDLRAAILRLKILGKLAGLPLEG
jgi:hypothetical protein